MKTLSCREITSFRKEVWGHYKKHGRDLPWRPKSNLRMLGHGRKIVRPYNILVSEIMLQQTQVSRVKGKYKEFIKAFPSFKKLAQAQQGDVLRVWQGLGYNRRARALHAIAKKVVHDYGGRLPKNKEILTALPGIGEATASSIRTFAFNKPEVFIETNIRSVFIYFFFKNKKNIHDKDIIPLVRQTLPAKNPREWYFALMDYGVMLKKEENPSRKSVHHVKQKPFKDSDRYIRGRIIKLLAECNTQTFTQIRKHFLCDKTRVKKCLLDLEKEGFIEKSKKYWTFM